MSASLSTHVLDTARGEPARGVRVALYSGSALVAEGDTGPAGRLALGDGLAAGSYRLVFAPESEFFARVELEIRLGDGHYHVPLLVSPFGCTTYRGS